MPTIVPDPAHLHLDHIRLDADVITLVVVAKAKRTACPLCGTRAERVHSRYVRTLADLPWNGVAVRLQLTVRRFVCSTEDCPRRIFAERFPTLAAPYARRTSRLTDLVEVVGFALGGEAGARVLAALTMGASPDTLLRTIRRAALPDHQTPRVLGVDDFAFRRGKHYGTILIDLERHCRIDLLPDRSAATLARWLQDHPGIEIISRDRGGAYAEGARQGAPDAVQVADRFHVLGNLRQAVERLLQRHHGCLRDIPSAPPDPSPLPEDQPKQESDQNGTPRPLTRVQRETEERRTRRRARYDAVLELYSTGVSMRAIARHLGLSRQTVRRYIRSEGFPEHAPRRPRPGIVTPFEPYLRARWKTGCHNAHQLWREIREQGYRGSRSQVGHVLSGWRTEPGRRTTAEEGTRSVLRPASESFSPRQASWLLFRDADELDADEQRQLAHITTCCAEAATLHPLVHRFRRLVRDFDQDALGGWLDEADRTGVPELVGFAAGIRRDRAAIERMLQETWSNGQVEGQVNRLKMIKRQMYGRANFDLLRQRVLRAS